MTRKLTLVNSLKLLILIFFCSLQKNVYAQAEFGVRTADTSNLVADFGADSTGAIDASYALIKASRYIENKWKKSGDTLLPSDPPNINYDSNYVRLEIPSGTYKVGKEISLMNGSPYHNLFHNDVALPSTTDTIKYSAYFGSGNNNEGIIVSTLFDGCTNRWRSKNYLSTQLFMITNAGKTSNFIDGVEIIGVGNTQPVFRYDDSLHLGWMDSAGNATVFYDSNANMSYNYGQCSYYWDLYHESASLFYTDSINNVKITNLEIDGNIPHGFSMGVGIDGLQSGAHGVRINGRHTTLNSIHVHNMQMDGIYFANQNCGTISYFFADSIVSDYNRRTGITWSDGDSIIVKHSKFNNIGRAVSLTQGSMILATNPITSMDIEYQNDCYSTAPQYLIKNGYFTNCEFENSGGTCVTNSYDSALAVRAKNVNFKHCTFWKTDGYGLWCQGRQFTFDSCKIYCNVVHSGYGDSLNVETRYNYCDFEDKPYIDTNAVSHHWLTGLNLIHIDGYKRTQFKDCTFTVNDNHREFALLKTGAVNNISEYITIQNCTFNYKNNAGSHSIPNPSNTEFDGVIFKGKNLFKNYLHDTNSYHNIKNETIIQDGSGDACNPSTLTVEGRISHCIMHSMHVNGFSTYIIEDEAQTCVDGMAGVIIDSPSKYIVKAGGSLNSGSSVEVNGEMIQEANSYLQMTTGNFINSQSGALLYIDPACNPNGITFNPIWGNSMIGQWYGTLLPLCVQGNHPMLSTYACSSPLYSNISTNGAFSVMYNHTNVKCNGGNTGSITCNVVGNNNCSFKLNTVTVSNPMTNLSAGTYTVIVSDTTCASSTNSFTVTITEPTILQISSASSTPILCNGGTSDLTVNASGGTSPYTYNLNGAAYQTSNIFNSNVAGTYTVSAKDANDCVSTSTIIISQPSILAWSTANYKNINCNVGNGEITVTTQGGTPTYEYKLNGGGFSSTNIYSISAVGTYTVTAKDANGCLITTTFIINAPTTNHCCSATANAIVATQNVILLHDPTAIQVLANYATSSNTLSNKTIYIDGTFTIDHDITFDSCTLYFTDLSYVQMQSPFTLNIDSSTLEASCDYWYGILADSVQQKVAIKNNSIIKDAIVGVYISKDALAEISDSHFINNQNSGIVFSNITSNNYAGFVLRNNFTSNSSMIAPYTKGSFGITVNNVTLLNIGDSTDAASGNDFTNLFTGIFVNNNYSSAGTPSSHIGIFNNTFENIKNTNITGNYVEALKMNNCYTGINVWTPTNSTPPQMICSDAGPAVGAAIFAKNTLFNMSDALINVKNTEPANNMLVMQNCDKGIVSISTSVRANNLYINNCMMGIMNATTTGKDYTIEHNTLNDIFLGIQVIDNPNTGTTINYNKINCSLYPNGIITASTMGAPMLWPKGIELSHFINTITNSLDVIEDTISIPHYAGLGISLNNAGSGVAVKNNIINLASNNATQLLCSGSTILAGISSNIALGARIHRNTINGNTAGVFNSLSDTSFGRVDAAGILINHGQNQAIGCNVISNTRFGLLAWDANNTPTGDTLNIQGNTVLGSDAGWVLRHLANEGTLGTVGGLVNDNNNVFVNLNTSAKVFKFCMQQLFDQIFTTSVTSSQSQSENMNTLIDDCPYFITTPNSNATIFSPNDCGALNIVSSIGDIRIEEALAIATDTKVYAEFPVLAHWYDSKRLYDYLTNNPFMMDTYPDLYSFYNAMTNTAIEQENNADTKLNELLESFAALSPTQREGQLGDAEQENEDIDYHEQQDENESIINAIYLRLLRYGIDSIGEDGKNFITELAPQCPYIGGSAVHKARTLNYYFNPAAMYDDMKTCNAVGVYKQGNINQSNSIGKSLITLEDEALANIKTTPDFINLKTNDILLYPNPTDGLVTIKYNLLNESEIIIRDITGRKVLVVLLIGETKSTQIDMKDLANGLYTYEIVSNKSVLKTGKINKQ